MTEIKRREKFRDVWLDILHSISGLCEVRKWSKNVSKLVVVDVSNGRAALSGSFINVRAPNFLQPKTSLSSCRRPLPFELFSKKRQLALVPSCRAFSRSTRCSFYWEKMDYLPHRHTDPFWGIFWVLECIFIFTTELVGMRNELTLSTYGQQITYPLHGKRAWPGSSVIIRTLQLESSLNK